MLVVFLKSNISLLELKSSCSAKSVVSFLKVWSLLEVSCSLPEFCLIFTYILLEFHLNSVGILLEFFFNSAWSALIKFVLDRQTNTHISTTYHSAPLLSEPKIVFGEWVKVCRLFLEGFPCESWKIIWPFLDSIGQSAVLFFTQRTRTW